MEAHQDLYRVAMNRQIKKQQQRLSVERHFAARAVNEDQYEGLGINALRLVGAALVAGIFTFSLFGLFFGN